jgi:hypothetical protein
MGRTAWQVNPWGKTLEPQRADLWVVKFDNVVTSFQRHGLFQSDLPSVPTAVYAQSVSLPEQAVRAEIVRRDSRQYHMPSWDAPLDAITMTFLLDTGGPRVPGLISLLSAWRAVVRAGRGPVSAENSFTLSPAYSTFSLSDVRPLHAYDIPIFLLKGYEVDKVNLDNLSNFNLQLSATLVLVNCWLAGYKYDELSYASGKAATVTATFYADDILPEFDSVQFFKPLNF